MSHSPRSKRGLRLRPDRQQHLQRIWRLWRLQLLVNFHLLQKLPSVPVGPVGLNPLICQSSSNRSNLSPNPRRSVCGSTLSDLRPGKQRLEYAPVTIEAAQNWSPSGLGVGIPNRQLITPAPAAAPSPRVIATATTTDTLQALLPASHDDAAAVKLPTFTLPMSVLLLRQTSLADTARRRRERGFKLQCGTISLE